MEKKERHYERYLKEGNCYEPIGETRDILPSGFYKPVYDSYHNRVYLASKEVIMPSLYVLPNDVQNTILDDIQTFWKSEERYRKFGNVYKRNILLYSLPGNGKTSLINIISKKLIDEYDGIVICIDSTEDLSSYRTVMERFRNVEPNRKVVTIIEDFERLANHEILRYSFKHWTVMDSLTMWLQLRQQTIQRFLRRGLLADLADLILSLSIRSLMPRLERHISK